jgi:hypothetical protein
VIMISLPVGFDVATFVSDLVSCAAPFVAVACIFLAYRVIIRALRGGN